jgi:hypothetical protein
LKFDPGGLVALSAGNATLADACTFWLATELPELSPPHADSVPPNKAAIRQSVVVLLIFNWSPSR